LPKEPLLQIVVALSSVPDSDAGLNDPVAVRDREKQFSPKKTVRSKKNGPVPKKRSGLKKTVWSKNGPVLFMTEKKGPDHKKSG
jgi:hypothetical protein